MKARRGHYLRENKGRAKPSRILFFDVESTLSPLDDTRTAHTFKLGWSLYWERRANPDHDTHDWRYYTSPGDFWDIVETRARPSQPLVVVAHNVGYDLSILGWDSALTSRGWSLVRLYCKGATTIIRMVKGKRKIVLLDNMNWFKCSLAALGDIVGLPKLDTDPLTAPDADLSVYCKRDVNIMYRAWSTWFDFIDTHDLGNWGTTLPSQAMAAYKHRFMRTPLLVHASEEATALERAAYHGGRTSVFYRGDLVGLPVHKMDLNSAYPWAMTNYAMPTRLLFLSHRVTVEELAEWITNKCVIAEVDLETNTNPFPVSYKGHNVYPVGSFRATLTTGEIALALRRGWVTGVVRAAVYGRGIIFSRYVNYFYRLKQEYGSGGNAVYTYMVKLLLNGLYGKFGQVASEFVEYGPVDRVCNDSMVVVLPGTGQCLVLYRFGDTLYTEQDRGETNASIPSIAAHVTAYVRLHLFALRERAGTGNVYYCDTDSLFVSGEGRHRLRSEVHPTRLGALKEEDVTDRLTILSPKTYRWADAWTRKGIPRSAVEVSPDCFEFTKWPSLRGIARRPAGIPFYTERTTRRLSYTLYDGRPGRDGWVVPLDASELTPPEHPSPEIDARLWEISVQIDALREAKTLDQAVVFKMWDYRAGTFKQARNRRHVLVPVEYSGMDGQASELGYPDLESLLHDVEAHVRIDEELAALTTERRTLLAMPRPELHPAEIAEPIPF